MATIIPRADQLATPGLLAYGLPALPLAAAALPIYVHLPNLYGGVLGMNLALLGAVLLAARLADALIDPLLGALADRWRRPQIQIGVGMLLLVAGSLLAFHPPADSEWLWAWLAVSLVPLYFGYSLASINHLAWGSLLGASPHERTRVAAWREGFGLAGVIAASLLPMLLATRIDQGLARYSLVLAALALACTLVMKIAAPSPHYPQAPTHALSWRDLFLPLGHPGFRHLFAVFMLNGIASALPATLVLFFISDALGLERDAGTFLAAYFGAGAVGLPLWMAISRHIGKVQAWRAAMLLAVAGFAGAWMLGSGDFAGFLAVCVISGLALGADLALPPSLLADLLRATADESRQANTSASETNGAGASEPIGAGAPEPIGAGASAGLWNFATKLNLALAAGLALPLLQFTGYTPGGSNIAPLYWAYCLLPCVLKLAAVALLSAPPSYRHTIPSVETRS